MTATLGSERARQYLKKVLPHTDQVVIPTFAHSKFVEYRPLIVDRYVPPGSIDRKLRPEAQALLNWMNLVKEITMYLTSDVDGKRYQRAVLIVCSTISQVEMMRAHLEEAIEREKKPNNKRKSFLAKWFKVKEEQIRVPERKIRIYSRNVKEEVREAYYIRLGLLLEKFAGGGESNSRPFWIHSCSNTELHRHKQQSRCGLTMYRSSSKLNAISSLINDEIF